MTSISTANTSASKTSRGQPHGSRTNAAGSDHPTASRSTKPAKSAQQQSIKVAAESNIFSNLSVAFSVLALAASWGGFPADWYATCYVKPGRVCTGGKLYQGKSNNDRVKALYFVVSTMQCSQAALTAGLLYRLNPTSNSRSMMFISAVLVNLLAVLFSTLAVIDFKAFMKTAKESLSEIQVIEPSTGLYLYVVSAILHSAAAASLSSNSILNYKNDSEEDSPSAVFQQDGVQRSLRDLPSLSQRN